MIRKFELVCFYGKQGRSLMDDTKIIHVEPCVKKPVLDYLKEQGIEFDEYGRTSYDLFAMDYINELVVEHIDPKYKELNLYFALVLA